MGETGGRAAGRALVALTDRAQAGAITLPLTRQGYQVDTLDNPEEARGSSSRACTTSWWPAAPPPPRARKACTSA